MTRIYVPQVRPILLVLAVLSSNAHSNEFFRPLIFLSSPDKVMLPLGLVNIQGYMGSASVFVAAGVVLLLLPVMVVYAFAQKYLIQGIVTSGVKG